MGLLRILALSLAMAPAAHSVNAFAQADQRAQASPSVRADDSSVFNLTPNVETVLPIRFASGAALPKQSAVLIQGIPKTLALNEGRMFDSGVWYVPVGSLPTLKILAPRDAAGLRAPLTMTLVSLDGTVLAEGRLTLAIGSPAPVGGRSPVEIKSTAAEMKILPAEGTAPPQRTADNPVSGTARSLAISPSEEAERLKSGHDAMALDDVAGARLIFEYLANRGSAAGAYRLAQTYDPQILARTTVGALFKPDEAVASKWYAKAAEMGNPDARKKIAGNR